jgi:hypothetical protein
MRDWKSQGYNEKQIADKLGIGKHTLYRMKLEFPDVAEALENGNDELKHDLLSAVYMAAKGHSKKVTTRVYRYDENGENKRMFELKEGELYFPPSETALKLILPIKFGREYSDRRFEYELKEKIIEASKDPQNTDIQNSNFRDIFKEAVREFEIHEKPFKKK